MGPLPCSIQASACLFINHTDSASVGAADNQTGQTNLFVGQTNLFAGQSDQFRALGLTGCQQL